MPREGQNRLGWDRFDGGIEQAPERAQPGQVLDARNMWAPDGLPERRPGTRFVTVGTDVDSFNPTNVTLSTVANGDGTFTYTVTIVAGILGTPASKEALFYLNLPAVGDNFDGPYIKLTQVSGPPSDEMTYAADRVYTGVWPTNTATIQNNVEYFFAEPAHPLLLAEITLADVKHPLLIFEWFAASIPEWRLTIDVPLNFRFMGASSTALVVDGITPTASRISTYVELPSLDRVLVTYDQTIYEISAPGGANIAPAVVNTDPDVVGPRQTLADGSIFTPPYSVDVLAQLASPPRAGIIVYFAGNIFALNLVDEPYGVRWSASTLDGYNVWPLVNFEPVDEDGGRPLAAKPLHEFLVVYQKQNIYTFVNDGIDPITGQATFDPKRVVSGVGALSHNGVVEVRGRHFIPALDGFYAFDGTPGIIKLSQPIDQFYRRLGVSALSQSRGIHWPEKHCVLWTMPQSGAPNPRALNEEQHYLILFDYAARGGAGAWWIWDGILGGGGLARIFAGDVIPGIYMMSSLSVVRRLTGNADIVDHNGTGVGLAIGQVPAVSELPAAYILTHRLGEPSYATFTPQELWVEADTHAATVDVTIIATDDDNLRASEKPVDMTGENDVTWGGTKWGKSTWEANKRRERPAGVALPGKHWQLKIMAKDALNRAWRFVRAALFNEKRFGRW